MKAREIPLYDVKARFSEVIQKVEEGGVYLVTKRGKAVAEIRPAQSGAASLTKGCAANPGYRMTDNFTETPADFAEYLR